MHPPSIDSERKHVEIIFRKKKRKNENVNLIKVELRFDYIEMKLLKL